MTDQTRPDLIGYRVAVRIDLLQDPEAVTALEDILWDHAKELVRQSDYTTCNWEEPRFFVDGKPFYVYGKDFNSKREHVFYAVELEVWK